MALAHRPYDGSRRPFTIGMSLLDPADWIEVDDHLPLYLGEKEKLLAERRDEVFREEAETRGAQAEILALLAEHLVAHFPETYRRAGSAIEIVPLGRRVALDGAEPPLLTASRLVQEDLCLMRDGPGGYRLAAASLCFPSAWSLGQKFGRTLDGLHDNVPGYGDGLGPRLNRIFSSLKEDRPVERLNWSIYADDRLHQPVPKEDGASRFEKGGAFAAFVRVERQTLRRLPGSGDLIFTIRVHVDPFDAFRRHPNGPHLAACLRQDLLRLDEAQLAYKGLLGERDRLAAALERFSRKVEFEAEDRHC